MRAQFITASEVAEIMGMSAAARHMIVPEMNRKLAKSDRCRKNALPSIHRSSTADSRTENEKTPPSSHLLAQMEDAASFSTAAASRNWSLT